MLSCNKSNEDVFPRCDTQFDSIDVSLQIDIFQRAAGCLSVSVGTYDNKKGGDIFEKENCALGNE